MISHIQGLGFFRDTQAPNAPHYRSREPHCFYHTIFASRPPLDAVVMLHLAFSRAVASRPPPPSRRVCIAVALANIYSSVARARLGAASCLSSSLPRGHNDPHQRARELHWLKQEKLASRAPLDAFVRPALEE
jgi:hypothetical protein